MTISLPPHCADRFRDILAEIPATQKRISVEKWHRCLGELHSMLLALPGSRGIFSQMQEALCHVNGKRVTITRGVHEALADFQWLAKDMASHPTRLFELVPLTPTLDRYHDSSGRMCGGVVLPGPSAIPRVLQNQPSADLPSKDKLAAHPIVWRVPYPQDIINCLVTYKNPGGDINNSDLELAGGVFNIVVRRIPMT